MSMLLVLCLAFFVLVFTGAWIVFRVIGMAVGALIWTGRAAVGANRPRFGSPIDRCVNDRCNAPWREGARFCPRCGQPRRNAPMLPAPTSGDLDLAHRPARAMSRFA